MANIEVHSKGETTSTSNHAVDLPSASSPSSSQPPFVSGGVSAPATPLLQSSLLQRSNSSSSFILGEASTSSRRQSELTSSDLQVLDKLSDSDELSSLNLSASAAPRYNLHSHSVVNESNTHVSYVYVAISIDDIVKPTTYKQAVESPLCDK